MTQVVGALRLAAVALNDADALLDGAHPAGRTSRNTAVYVAFTLLGTLVQLALVLVVSTAPALALAALPVGLLVPVGSFALGWLSLGAVFGLPRHRRTPGFGAVVSAVALLPLAALAGWLALGAPGDGSG